MKDMGVRFNLVYQDSQMSASVILKSVIQVQTNTSYYNPIVSGPVVGYIGEYASSNTMPMNLVVSSFGTLQCGACSTNAALSNKGLYKTFYRIVPSDTYQAPAVARFMHSRGWRKVAVVANNGAYGLGLAQNFQVAVQKLNMTLLANIPFVNGITDFSTTVASLKASGARVVFIAMYNLPDAVYFMREAKKQGMVGPEYQYIGPDGVWPVYEDLRANMTESGLTESDWDNFQGVIAFTQNDQSGTATFKQLSEWYMDKYGMGVPQYGAPHYDCVMSFAYALSNFLKRSNITAAQYASLPLNERMTFEDMQKTTFNGSLGPFSIDSNGDPGSKSYRIANFYKREFVDVAKYAMLDTLNGSEEAIPGTSIYYSTALSKTPPADSQVLQDVSVSYTQAGPIFFIVYYLVNFVLTLITGVIVFLRRERPVVKNLSLPFLMLITFGLLLCWLSIFGFVSPFNRHNCGFGQWVLWIGFSIVMSSLLVKVFRIWRIFDNQSKLSNSSSLSNTRLFMYASGLVLINVIILIVWSAIDPLVPSIASDSSTSWVQCTSTHQNIFMGVLLAYNGLLLLAVSILAILTRGVFSQFRESFWIAQSSMIIFFTGCIALIILFAISSSIALAFYIRTVAVAFATTSTYYCLIGRILFIKSEDSDKPIFSSMSPSKKHSPSKLGQPNIVGSMANRSINNQPGGNSLIKTFEVIVKETSSSFSTWRRSRIVVIEDKYFGYMIMSSSKEGDSEKSKPVGLGKFSELSKLVLYEMGDSGDSFAVGTNDGKLSLLIQCHGNEEKLVMMACLKEKSAGSSGLKSHGSQSHQQQGSRLGSPI